MLKILQIIICLVIGLLIGFCLGLGIYHLFLTPNPIISPIGKNIFNPSVTHLNRLAIPYLVGYPLNSHEISLVKQTKSDTLFDTFIYESTLLDKKMTGLINIPQNLSSDPKAIILIRGYVPKEIYQPGVGTRAAGEALAEAGYLTLAPDFLGYGGSDPEPEDVMEARFIKPIQIMELIKDLQEKGINTQTISQTADQAASISASQSTSFAPRTLSTTNITANRLGIWAHSNGGQIALTALEGLGQPIPTTLWAPVTAPFPYSVLYFSDEEADEGKASRANIALFEKNYNAADFSLTQHLDLLKGPLQLHQGLADEAVPYLWNREFRDKIVQENKKRSDNKIQLNYFEYPGTDHNLKPSWDSAMTRDIEFFAKNIK